ncbi:MAG: RluA family pseudouridine synthase [Gammaproteobacteria bacterium]|nr:RluA family pseudouridine synthase [Gammaproteobacteria bacterium]MBQ0774424.1 RluA family pseudouridine synthase [Gammaproteobacteria bacterium]
MATSDAAPIVEQAVKSIVKPLAPVTDTFIAPICHEDIEILFEDESLLLINKPSGLLSLSGKNPLNKDSVHYRLEQMYPSATMVHRLDFGTSGIMVVALNKTVNATLTKQFQRRTISKTYIAMLDGELLDDTGVISAPIAKDPPNFPRVKICQQAGKAASSAYQVLERLQSPQRTRVLFTPQTGRTHQLRIHSQAIGHVILGCDLYGNNETLAAADRLLLHAATLAFDHPVTGNRIVGECACPF